MSESLGALEAFGLGFGLAEIDCDRDVVKGIVCCKGAMKISQELEDSLLNALLGNGIEETNQVVINHHSI